MTRGAHFTLTETTKFLKKIAAEEREINPESMRAATAEQLAEDIDYQLRTEYTTAGPMYTEAAA